ncbi:OLC1v1031691C1 [Oldenlandia corymbosa var. corymbosa]|uniref:OLC1v1031691C1 n=1 Tax=Oldenlandia corymbosa var. corymbosa TaxID=529605 RepID=A0AAV1CM07_OLDCO|nr:OLC1v1031691C1 [Oldenlandia corymbosa var. corymbosa]
MQPATPNHTIHNNHYFLYQNFSVNVLHFNNIPQSHHQPECNQMNQLTYRQAIYAFILTVSLNLVQIKYQSLAESPFETHPKTMFLAVASLLLYYCLSQQPNLNTIPLYAISAAYWDYFSRLGLGFCGPLSLASVTSLLLPESLCPLVFSLALLFALSQLIPHFLVETIWDMLIKTAIYIVHKFWGQRPPDQVLGRTGRGIHVQLPNWLPQQVEIEIHPH